MKKFYLLLAIAAVMLLSLPMKSQNAKQSVRYSVANAMDKHLSEHENRKAKMNMPQSVEQETISELPFTVHLEDGDAKELKFTLDKESMVKVIAKNVNDTYVYIDDLSLPSAPEVEMRLDSGEHIIYLSYYGDEATEVEVSLGEKVYKSVDELKVTDIELPYKSGALDFNLMADTLMVEEDVFVRGIFFKLIYNGKSRFFNVTKLGSESVFNYHASVDFITNDVIEEEGVYKFYKKTYLVLYSTGKTAEIEIEEKIVPSAAEVYKNAESITLPYEGDVQTGREEMYFPDDSDKEDPLYYKSLTFTLTKDETVSIINGEIYAEIVRSDNDYVDFEDYKGGLVSCYELKAGTYYVVFISERPNTKSEDVKIMIGTPEWWLDSYKNVDYAEKLTSGKMYGKFKEGESPMTNDFYNSCVKGYTVEMKAGHSYRFLYTVSSKDIEHDNEFQFYLMKENLSGDINADLVLEGENNTDDGLTTCKMIVNAEEDMTCKMLITAETYRYGEMMYSLSMIEEKTTEHYVEMTLPMDKDTLMLKDKAMQSEGGYYYSYGWKVTVAEPSYIKLNAHEAFYVYVKRGNPNTGENLEPIALCDNYNIYDFSETGEYYITVEVNEDKVVHIYADKVLKGDSVDITSLPYEQSETPAGVVFRDGYDLYYVWKFESDRDTSWIYECVADGQTILSTQGFPKECNKGVNSISVPFGHYKDFKLTVKHATGKEYNEMTLAECMDGVTEDSELPLKLQGTIDVNSPLITDGELSGYLLDVHKVSVKEIDGATCIEFKNPQLYIEHSQILVWDLVVLKKEESGYSIMDKCEFNYYSDFKVDLTEPGDYYIAVGLHTDVVEYAGDYSIDASITNNFIEIEELFDGLNDYTTLPITVQDTMTDETQNVSDGFRLFRCVAYKIKLQEGEGLSVKMKSNNAEGGADLFKKESDGSYVQCHEYGTGDYYLAIYGKSGFMYELEAEKTLTIEKVIEDVTSTTALPAIITIDQKSETLPKVSFDANIKSKVYYANAYKYVITDDDIINNNGMQMMKCSIKSIKGVWYYLVFQKIDTRLVLISSQMDELGNISGYPINESGEYYFVPCTEDEQAEISMQMSLKEVHTPDAENALTIEELLSQAKESSLPLEVKDKSVDAATVSGGNGFMQEGEYYLTDVYKVAVTDQAGLYVRFETVYDDFNLYIYKEVSDGYELWASGRLGDDIGYVSAYGNEMSAGTYYLVIVDSQGMDVNSYDLYLSSPLKSIEDKLRCITESHSIPYTVNGVLNSKDVDAVLMYDGTAIVANVHCFDLKKGDCPYFSITENVFLNMYLYDETNDKFIEFHDSYIEEDCIAYVVAYFDMNYFMNMSRPYVMTIGSKSSNMRPVITSLKFNPEFITVNDINDEMEVRMELFSQVKMDVLYNNTSIDELETTAFGWNIDKTNGVATYEFGDKYDFAQGVDSKVTVYINPETVTATVTAGEHGKINPSGIVEMNKGLDKEFEITPDYYSYVIDEVFVNGKAVKSGLEGHPSGTYVLEDAEDGMTLHVTFALSQDRPLESFTVNLDVNDKNMGMIKKRVYGYPSDEEKYCNGTMLELYAVAFDGYRFVKWSDGNRLMVREIMVTGDTVLTAEFAEINKFTVDVVPNDKSMGTVYIEGYPLEGDNVYAEGSLLRVEAEAEDGYVFVKWSDGETDPERTLIVTDNIQLVAQFESIGTGTETVWAKDPTFTVYSERGMVYVESYKVNEDIYVYDISGRLIYSGKNRSIYIGTPGIYIIVLDGESRKIAVK